MGYCLFTDSSATIAWTDTSKVKLQNPTSMNTAKFVVTRSTGFQKVLYLKAETSPGGVSAILTITFTVCGEVETIGVLETNLKVTMDDSMSWADKSITFNDNEALLMKSDNTPLNQ